MSNKNNVVISENKGNEVLKYFKEIDTQKETIKFVVGRIGKGMSYEIIDDSKK